ncbi:DUF1269 domain-containing protein [Thermoleptolyngbya sp. C42_A2020_037]|uniref:DUF1269 domain-containing protein n=1 Tax=Thermoleptolyngbya sp. C42_A2020_037 TaxID=2747799 RepID=UPI0019F7F090|nr:DUF1269 domain-containing protein [Thermoleptolyngbya sp. C42_A2020_037]MBF2083167.1 DUF1269 domain-containing protein [Thermoleptolyngbya sp. C42_A2020_037]
MSELIVVVFDQKLAADHALLDLLKREQSHLADFEDAVVVTKNAQGKIRVKAYHDLLEPVGELSNDLWGGILSAVVFHRSLAIAQEIFNPDFLLRVEEALQPNSSALLVLVHAEAVDRVVEELFALSPIVIKTPLPDAKREALKQSMP